MSPAMDYSAVADLYDTYCIFEDDLPFFVDTCRDVTGPVLELMCGTGRVSIPLLHAGVDLTCVDSSPDMLRVFRRKLGAQALSAKVICADVSSLALPPIYDLAFIPFHSFSELVDRPAQDATLADIYRVLRPGGAFICTLHNPAVRLRSIGHGPSTLGPIKLADGSGDVLLRSELSFDRSTGRVHGTQTIQQRDTAGAMTLERNVAIEFVLIDRPAFAQQVHAAGFDVVDIFGDYHRAPFSETDSPYMIWIMNR